MIELRGFELNINEFQFLQVEDTFDLTNAFNIDENFKPIDGGITLEPNFEIDNIKESNLFINQICKYHRFKITIGSEEYNFKIDEPHKDTVTPSGINYETYKIENNIIKNQLGNTPVNVKFFDALQRELFNHWSKFEYEIQFETWFQYNNKEKLTPIFSFNWNMSAKCLNQNGNWSFIKNEHSSIADIKDSIRQYTPEDNALYLEGLPHLKSEVNKFYKRNQSLLP